MRWLDRDVVRLLSSGRIREALTLLGYHTELLTDLPDMEMDFESKSTLRGIGGIWHADFLTRLGEFRAAKQLVLDNDRLCTAITGECAHIEFGACRLLLAQIAVRTAQSAAARRYINEAYVWAVDRDAKDPMCLSQLNYARIGLQGLGDRQAQSDARRILGETLEAIECGLRIARDCGFGIHYIDLLLTKAEVALHEGRADDAHRDVKVALDEGIHPPPESGLPTLLAATDPECGYAWGIAEGRHWLGQALLLKAAQKLGKAEFAPARFGQLPDEVRKLIDGGREQLESSLESWRQLKDPESDATINPHGEPTQRAIEQLDGGVLTSYPIRSEAEQTLHVSGGEDMTRTARDQVFISYSCQDKEWLDRLQTVLKPLVRKQAIDVWDDARIKTGQKWKDEITQALARAKVAVLLVSHDFLASDFIADEEVPPILAAADSEGLTIVWVPVTASLYEETDIAKYQAAHDRARPLDGLAPAELNQALVDIAKKIRDAANP